MNGLDAAEHGADGDVEKLFFFGSDKEANQARAFDPGKAFLIWSLYYKTYYDRNLRIFVIS